MTIATLATAEQRREELLRLAEAIDDGPDPSLALELLVPPLCAAHLPTDRALALFEELIYSVREHRSYTTDQAAYAVAHDQPTTPAVLAVLDEGLLADIDATLDQLLGGAA